ncbi:MAG TPA: hypothetical protein VF288_10575 [Mycobacteriales bacterium]
MTNQATLAEVLTETSERFADLARRFDVPTQSLYDWRDGTVPQHREMWEKFEAWLGISEAQAAEMCGRSTWRRAAQLRADRAERDRDPSTGRRVQPRRTR